MCRNLDENTVTRMTERSSGSKQRFFELVALATRPYNLTQVAWNMPSIELSTTASIGFLGDSTVRELSGAYAAIAPAGEAMYFTESYVGKALAAFRRDSSTSSCSGEWCALEKLLKRHAARPFDALIMGGFQHYNFRHVPWNRDSLATAPEGLGFDHRIHAETVRSAPREGPTNHRLKAHSPYRNHRLLVEEVATALGCLAAALRTPIVLSGTVYVDATGVLMDPPKHDWDTFHDLSLPKIMSAAERDVARQRANTAEAVDSSQETANAAPASLLHFLHPSEVSAMCPGIRCDGIHFGSFYHRATAGFECAQTKAAWHEFVAEFLLRSGLGCPRQPANAAITGRSSHDRVAGEAGGAAAIERRLLTHRNALTQCLRNYTGW